MPKKAKGSKSVLKLDFTGTGGRGERVEEGDYILKITKITLEKAQTSGKNFVRITSIIDNKCKEQGSTVVDQCSLQPQALWRFRNTLQAMGKKIPEKVVNIDIKKLVGLTYGATIEDEEYEGTTRSKVVDVWKPSMLKKKQEAEEELNEDEEEEETEEDEEEEEESEEEEEEEEDDEEEELEELEEL